MPSQICQLCGLAFFVSLGGLLLILACALHQFDNWLPLTSLVPYFLLPLPYIIARRSSGQEFDASADNSSYDVAIFISVGIAISGYGIPMVLLHADKIAAGAAYLTMGSTTVVYIGTLVYFRWMDDDGGYGAL